jgi:hypothetical protein
MAIHSVTTGTMMCTFGVAPSVFNATPKMVSSSFMQVGNIMDNIPITNIPPFGMCTSLANPTVASATAAALGVLTPMPCVPVTPAPWTPMPCVPVTPAPWTPGAPTVLVNYMPALNNTSCLMCMWGGQIRFTYPGQTTEMIP